MNKYILDTMALVLYLEHRKLPQTIKNYFIEAEHNNLQLLIPAITLAEISYLSEKGRITITLEIIEQLLQHYTHFQIVPLTLEIIKASFEITDVPELHDRLIAGTAKHFDIPLLTNDPIIEKSTFVKTIWN